MPEINAGVNITLTVDGTDLEVSSTHTDINAQTGTSYTLVLADAGKLVTCANASPVTVTLPANASVALPVGTVVGIAQLGAGTVTIAGASGVTVNGTVLGSEDISAQYGTAAATKIATDTWLVSGSLS
jgi:hypothetical protein